MAAPIFDAGLVIAALADLVPRPLASVVALGGIERADPAKRLRQLPGVAVVPESTRVAGEGGMGNARTVTERLAVITQVREVAGRDAQALAELSAIRAAVWERLEALRPSTEWSPLRFDGGRLLSIDEGVYSWIDYWITQTGTTTAPRTV